MATVAGFMPSTHGLHFDNCFPHEPDLTIDILGQKIPVGDAANGLCGGFVYTVMDLWEAQLPVPSDQSAPAGGTPLFNYLVQRLFDSFALPLGPSEYLALMNPLLPDHEETIELFGHGRAWIMINEQWPAIKADIDAGKLSPLGLVRVKSANPGDLGQNHQVLAYGYDLNGTSLALHVYDPNRRDDDSVRLSLDIGDPDHTTAVSYTGDSEPVYCFFRTPYGWKDPSAIAGTVHEAQPVQLGTLTVAARPFNAAFGHQVSVTVSAVDSKTHAAVSGDVSMDGVVVGRTNTPFTHTFTKENIVTGVSYDIYDGVKRVFYRDYPIGMVRAAGYEDAWLPFGSTREEDERIPKALPNNFRSVGFRERVEEVGKIAPIEWQQMPSRPEVVHQVGRHA